MRRRFIPLALLVLSGSLTLFACEAEGPAAPPPPPLGAPCGYHDDCEVGEVCSKGTCEGTRTCFERKDCATLPMCDGFSCICPERENRCLPICITDNDCPADGHCLDGNCERYPVAFDGLAPGGEPRRALEVGLSRVEADVPVGVSMAGYAMRRGPSTPYRNSLGGSDSWFDKPDMRAVVFDDGGELIVLLRIPTSWSTDFMIAATAEKVQARTGLNLVDNIITTSPHSHSHPARFWHLVKDKGFGIFGYDEFEFEIFDRLTDSMAEAVVMALDDRRPARFGYTVLEDFDPNNRIHRDRRGQNDGLGGYRGKDARMVLMRVDEMDGTPRAILTHFGMHGTVFGFRNPILTGDAGGGVETYLTGAASKKYGRPVMGLYIQGNAGDISPAGDDLRHSDLERIQLIGQRTWAVIEPALDAITTRADVRVSTISHRVPITHEILGYAAGAFFDEGVSCESSPEFFRFGAFQCVEGFPGDDEDPTTRFFDGDLHCVFAVECLTGGHAVPQFQKTRLSVAQIGGLALATMPGEPLSQFGREVSDRVAEAAGADDALVVGYSQDHHFYLLSEEDWWQGGYEPSRDIWGWRLAPYLADQSVALAAQLADEPNARQVDNGNLKPMYWPATAEERERVPATDTPGDPQDVLTEVPAQVDRMDVVEFSWRGGHPGLDRPQITLQREVDGTFEAVEVAPGAVYDDAGFEMLVTYLGECGRRNCENHAWRVRWEDGRDFALGRYRLVAQGTAQTAGSVAPYTTTSTTFVVRPARLELQRLAATPSGLTGVVSDPPAIRLVPGGDGFDAEPAGHRLRSPLTSSALGTPLPASTTLTVTGTVSSQGQRETITGVATTAAVTRQRSVVTGADNDGNVRWRNGGELPSTEFSIATSFVADGPPGEYYVQLTLTDDLGNVGTITATITK